MTVPFPEPEEEWCREFEIPAWFLEPEWKPQWEPEPEWDPELAGPEYHMWKLLEECESDG